MTFELSLVAPTDVDDAIAELGNVRLERVAGRLLITCTRVTSPHTVATLCRVGIAARPTVPITPTQRAATVDHLRAFAVDGLHDVVDVRVASLGEAVALVRAATRGLFGHRARERRERLGALLAERERLILWRRAVYAPAAVLRSGRLAGARPVVFDQRGIARARERSSPTSAGMVTAWIRS